FENMMVDLQLTNKKLEERAKRIVMIATNCEYPRAEELLLASRGHVKTAIVMERAGCNLSEAEALLNKSDGFVKGAIQLIRPG
ncbi:MAG TPA: N-acetylmuramic acid 6-phosphate etherase, partial [Candidatus Kapabacteria bacterium]|nr:N-acetylmuramic acid 6-phosphate etherase [Candidatus Kapabacteria bacterium]